MHGNRDFLVGKAFADHCGMQLLPDPTVVTLHCHTVLLSHGDAWCTDDIDYQQFRQMVRNPEWQKTFLAQPITNRIQQAQEARIASQSHTAKSDSKIMDVNPNQIQQAFDKYSVKQIIHGHTHRPNDHHYAGGLSRFVLGDWYNQSSWFCIDQSGITRHGALHAKNT